MNFYFLGQYQIKQAKSYIREHLKPSEIFPGESEFLAEECENHSNLVRARFASRHSSSKNYIATVEFDNERDEEPITGWYCTCAAGARAVGCCGHVAALLWHMGVCRGQPEEIVNPLSSVHFHDFIHDAADMPDDSDSSDDSGTGPVS